MDVELIQKSFVARAAEYAAIRREGSAHAR